MESVLKKKNKFERVLGIYTRLLNGYSVNKKQMALEYNVDERSIQRDIDDIRGFLENNSDLIGVLNTVIYDRSEKEYRLEKVDKIKLNNSEVLAICKILLDSRAVTKSEMETMIYKLINCCVPKNNQSLVRSLIQNEEFHYVELGHKTIFIDKMWEIGKAIHGCHYIEIDYQKLKDKEIVRRKLQPVAIMFSEYYFYLTAFIADEKLKENFDVLNDAFPTIYRMDRIQHLKVLNEKFRIPYHDRFEEGEFRKRIQFMYGGKLQKVIFRYAGNSVEAILDKLPTARILKEEGEIYTIEAEVFGKGIEIWLRSQKDIIEIVKPESLRKEMKTTLQEMLKHYQS